MSPLLSRRPTTEAARAYAAAPVPPRDLGWREVPWAVVDLETTGLDLRRDEVVSFGVVPIDRGRIVAGGAVHGLVRPVREVPAESIVIHGIRPADLARAPEPPQAFAPLLDATAGRVLIAHAAWVERGFLRRALRPLRMRPREPIIDTAILGRLLMHQRDGVSPRHLSLAALVNWLGLPAHHPHHALGDALTTAQAFLALAAHLDAARPQTIASLADADRRLSGLQTFHPRQL